MQRTIPGIVLTLTLALVFFAGCGSTSFAIIESPKPDSEGFLSGDILQITGVGYPAADERDAVKRKKQALDAAVIYARLRAVEYLLSELQTESGEKAQTVLMKIGSRIMIDRYEPVWSAELSQGGYKADGYFDLMTLNGFVFTNTYEPLSGRAFIVYRVAKAGLVQFAKNGFGML